MSRDPRVLIVYQHLPHYRSGVFGELQNKADITYEFAADTVSRDGSIPTIPAISLREFHGLTNRWFGPFLWQAGLIRLLLREKFQAVIFLGDVAYLSTWVGAAMCRAFGIQVLYWTIGWHRPERGLRKHARLTFYRIPHALLLYGNTAQRIGRKLGYPVDRMTVIGNSHTSHPASDEAATSLAMNELQDLLPESGDEVLTAVVRLNPAKRLDLLLRAAARLRDVGRPVKVLLVGAGPEREALLKLAADLDIELRLTGPIYCADQLKHVYERTTVTVVPACAGLTAVQSLAHGRPVITCEDEYHQMPESECVRPGYTGDFYEDGSVESLATSISNWLDRMKSDKEAVVTACHKELEMRWSPQGHSAAIHSVVLDRLGMRVRSPQD